MFENFKSGLIVSEEIRAQNSAHNMAFWQMLKLIFWGGLFLILLGYLVFGMYFLPSNNAGRIIYVAIFCIFLGGILGVKFKKILLENHRVFENKTSNIEVLEGDALNAYFRKSAHKFSPEVIVKLDKWKICTDPNQKNKLILELTKLLDTDIANLQGKRLDAIEKPLHTKERKTLLIIIAALAKEAKYDLSKTSKSAELLSKVTQEMGSYVSDGAIADKFKQIPDALELRMK